MFGVANEICSVFHEHSPLLAAFELESDVTEFYEKGAGAGLSYGLACVLLEDMFDEMDTHVSGRTSDGSPLVFGEFRVGHAETISPFIALLVCSLFIRTAVRALASHSSRAHACRACFPPPRSPSTRTT